MRIINSSKRLEEHKKILNFLLSERADFSFTKEKIKAHLEFLKVNREEFLVDLVSCLVHTISSNQKGHH
jgi:hypothetical protein